MDIMQNTTQFIAHFIAPFFTIWVPMIGAVYYFHKLIKDDINKMGEATLRLDQIHREDMKSMDAKWQHLDQIHREDMKSMDAKWERMDAKWERLFERLLLQDQQRASQGVKS